MFDLFELLFYVTVSTSPFYGTSLTSEIGFEYEPVREKIKNLGFRPGPTQTGLYSQAG